MSDWRLLVYPVLAIAVLIWMRGLWRELQQMKSRAAQEAKSL